MTSPLLTRKQTLTLSAIVIGNIIVDQVTKLMAIALLKGQMPLIYLGNFFRFEYIENPGAFLGLGGDLNPLARFLIFSAVVGGFLGGLTVYVFRGRGLDYGSRLALAFVAGGGFSNLIDRLFRDGGRVVDFMNVGIGGLRTGIFNVADMAILFSVIYLVLISFTQKKR